jgi:very-short-patch-repair endonuclease
MFFIADFYCHEAKLVVEVDGEIHNENSDYDDGRSAEMENFGIIVLRVTNAEVETSLEKVINNIRTIVNGRLKSPPWGI